MLNSFLNKFIILDGFELVTSDEKKYTIGKRKKTTDEPKIKYVHLQPKTEIEYSIKGISNNIPIPLPESAIPVAIPLFLLNHFGIKAL